jgi:dGTPase
VVDEIEAAFFDFPGLNLTWSTREGIARHSTPFDEPASSGEFAKTRQGGLECQLVDAADILAYLAHDLDDALADGFIRLPQLADLSPAFAALVTEGERRWAGRRYQWPEEEEDRLLRRFLVAKLISKTIEDLVEASTTAKERLAIETSEDIRSAPARVVVQSKPLEEMIQATLNFLTERYYRSEAVRDSDAFAEDAIAVLFEWYMVHPDEVPKRFRISDLRIAVATYIASLNDRVAAGRAHDLGLATPSAPA